MATRAAKRTASDHAALIAAGSAAVHKRYKDTYSMLAEEALETPSVFVSLGALALDRLCRGYNPGGLPIGPTQGRAIHIAGEWSCGKSVMLDHAIKSAQDLGGLGIISETEGSRDEHFARAIGTDFSRVEIQRPRTVEEFADAGLEWHAAIRKQDEKIPIVWGLDSVDSTGVKRSLAKGMSEGGGWHYGGGKGEALGEALRRIVNQTARYPTTVIMLNQTRDNVGVMFGPKKRTTGGGAPHFYASLELMLTPSPMGVVRTATRLKPLAATTAKALGLLTFKGAPIDTGKVVGRWVRAQVSKTKMGATYLDQADFFIDFRKGISKWGGIINTLLREGIVEMPPKAANGVIRHRTVEGELVDFDSNQAWLNWLAKHARVELGARAELE